MEVTGRTFPGYALAFSHQKDMGVQAVYSFFLTQCLISGTSAPGPFSS